MHGRLKVKTTAEQQAAKLKEQEKKLKLFSAAWDRLIDKRKVKDYDKEALELSAQILSKIPDVQTLWNIRKETFLFLKENLDTEEYSLRCKDELAFTEHCLQINPKSYGCWEHRCWIMDNSPNPDWSLELALCNQYLDLDERNFHCWDYRRFVVKRSQTDSNDEFKYTTDKISANFSNFSSWHYRSKLLPELFPDRANAVGIRQDILLTELNMVQNAFFTDPNDQSAWFYHRWLLGRVDIPVKLDLVLLTASRCRLLLRFTKPVKDSDIDLKLYINDTELQEVIVEPVSMNSKASKVLSCNVNNKIDIGSVLKVEVNSEINELRIEDSVDLWVENTATDQLSAIDFSQAAKDVLMNELDMLRQLHDLEPDNKWAMLTIISLVRNLSPMNCMKEVNDFLTKLISVDPYRTKYYSDMRSKYAIESVLRTESNESRAFDLSCKELTHFYHAEKFLKVTELNLSGNYLTRLNGIYVLQNLRVLNANKNRIESLDDVGVLSELEELYVEDNRICDKSCFDVVRKQPKLLKFKLSGNPVLDEVMNDEFSDLFAKFGL